MAALYKQKGVELMRWHRDGSQLAYFAGGRVLSKHGGEGWKRAGHWSLNHLSDIKEDLATGGWVQTRSMGKRLADDA